MDVYRKKAIQDLNERAHNLDYPPMLIFPEGNSIVIIIIIILIIILIIIICCHNQN